MSRVLLLVPHQDDELLVGGPMLVLYFLYGLVFVSVPAALKELEKIEMLKGAVGEYNLDYAVTATQKTILNAFGMTADNIHRQARGISADLARIEMEAVEKQAAESEEGSV